MNSSLQHDLALALTQEEKAKRSFVSALRSHVLQNMAVKMRAQYFDVVKPNLEKQQDDPETPARIHKAMRSDKVFKAYSSVRTAAQEMVFDVVSDTVDRHLTSLIDRPSTRAEIGTLTLDSELALPSNVTAIDVHLSPGSYRTEYADNDMTAGAIYDNSIDVFAFGQFGKTLDDICSTLANYVRLKFPGFSPEAILDCGCTIGHNTLPWAQAFPAAQVTAIDVASPGLRYGHARAESLGIPVHFKQMNAVDMAFEDNSFDVVFSSMFLHELPLKDIHRYLKEAYRVLKPGGLLWQMELPPMSAMPNYENFYMNWDSHYNNEPFYATFRAQDYRQLLVDAGFDAEHYVEATMPRYTFVGEEAFTDAIADGTTFDTLTGRMDPKGTRWYGFGAWKN